MTNEEEEEDLRRKHGAGGDADADVVVDGFTTFPYGARALPTTDGEARNPESCLRLLKVELGP